MLSLVCQVRVIGPAPSASPNSVPTCVYDGNDPNDRLLLGLKGMSEMELHIMRNRLERGRDYKAQRGELFMSVPMGYVILPTGKVDFDPDEQAREVMQLIFDKFDELGTIYGLFHWLIDNAIRLPVRPQSGRLVCNCLRKRDAARIAAALNLTTGDDRYAAFCRKCED